MASTGKAISLKASLVVIQPRPADMRSEPKTQADGAKGMVIAPLALKLARANDVSERQTYAFIHQSEAALNLADERFPLYTVARAPGIAVKEYVVRNVPAFGPPKDIGAPRRAQSFIPIFGRHGKSGGSHAIPMKIPRQIEPRAQVDAHGSLRQHIAARDANGGDNIRAKETVRQCRVSPPPVLIRQDRAGFVVQLILPSLGGCKIPQFVYAILRRLSHRVGAHNTGTKLQDVQVHSVLVMERQAAEQPSRIRTVVADQ